MGLQRIFDKEGEHIIGLLIPMIREFVKTYNDWQMVAMIQQGDVPMDFMDIAIPYVFDHPELATLGRRATGQEEFVEALARALPQHAALVRSPLGRAWCLKAGDAIGPQVLPKMAGHIFKSLFGGKG